MVNRYSGKRSTKLHREWTRGGSGVTEGWVTVLLLGRGYDDNNNKKKSLRTYPYGLEGFFAAGSAFPLENEIMTECMQWKDRIANRCPIGLIPPGVMNCVCVYTFAHFCN